MKAERVSICLATYRRPEQLAALLDDLLQQTRLPDEIVVIDNDSAASARAVVEALPAHAACPIRYQVQPEKNISITRNLTVAGASGNWLAFIDDDERAPRAWLQQLLDARRRHDADGVLGPVLPVIPASAPGWIRRGRFYEWP
ncbi:MAG TPA: glycosyltransferase, partial [Nevskiaceae bacterium]|nr:glycosyltransferase [Nevskiaceae bacterium]